MPAKEHVVIVPAFGKRLERGPSAATAPNLALRVRGTLVLLALGLIAVFAVAWLLDPYEADGTARHIGTHQQLGMPPCTFYVLTKLPCPSCGLTTSMSLVAHGDLNSSLQANFVGTLIAAFALIAIPWSLASAFKARFLGIRSLESALTWFVAAFVILLMVRWIAVIALRFV